MTSGVPPAIRKRDDRLALLSDLAYFSQEAARRAEQLQRIDKNWRKPVWQQCAALARRVRNEARSQADDHRHRAKLRGVDRKAADSTDEGLPRADTTQAGDPAKPFDQGGRDMTKGAET